MMFLQNITEGGQLTTHNMRMFRQVTKTSVFFVVLIWLSVFAYKMRDLNMLYLKSAWYYEQASLYKRLNINIINVDQNYWYEVVGQKIDQLPISTVIQTTKPYAERFYRITFKRVKESTISSMMPLFFILAFFFIIGRHSGKKHLIKGNKISSAWIMGLKLKLRGLASRIKIGPLPLLKGTETQHVLITGGTGSGKTNCLHHLLTSIRKEKKRAIIVDTTGILTEIYYREGKDILLNPTDSRSASWHPWADSEEKTSYAAMAESFIPQSLSESDNYWRTGARTVLSSILERLEDNQRNSALCKKVLIDPLQELCEFVIGTKAASLIDINSEKTAASIRSVLSSFLTCFEYMQDTENPFSISKWVKNDDQSDEWLFIACKTNQRPALTPLLSCWFSVAVRSLLDMEPDFDRRLWFIIDELPTLNRLRDLETLLTESRKYGGCATLVLQSPAQLEAIYGQASAQTIMGNCGTKIVFCEQNPINAGRISELFGEQEIREYQKGLSYGANDIRDGVNLNQHIRTQPLITKTDIQFLSRNQAFVRIPDNHPVVKLNIPIIKKGKK